MQAEQGEGQTFPLDSQEHTGESRAIVGDSILRRGSTRRFDLASIAFSQLSAILRASKAVIPFDFLPADRSLIDISQLSTMLRGFLQGPTSMTP